MEKRFYLDDILDSQEGDEGTLYGELVPVIPDFLSVCQQVKEIFFQRYQQEENLQSAMEIQKRAIVGYQKEMDFYKEKIAELVAENKWEAVVHPQWYENLVDGIYHENWGMAGMAEWFSPKFMESSSAKIIGDRIYFLHHGQMMLMPQKISSDRRDQMIRAFLLLTPEERLDREFHEVYLLDGTRITIFKGNMTKKEQDVIIFRRYIIPNYTFEEQARRHTIPEDAIPLFRAMVDIGFSIVCTGAVRTSKTTFLATWQQYEDPSLEGVLLETDPEIPLHMLMPRAPIVQLLADNERLKRISKNLLRSDADYFILAEARDGKALDTAVRIASKGTKRMKMTFHTRNPLDLPGEVASEIIKTEGGQWDPTRLKVAESFDYIFHFVQLADKSQKRLRGIYEMGLTKDRKEVYVEPICLYDYETDDWMWIDRMGGDKEQLGLEENRQALQRMKTELHRLAEEHPAEVRKQICS
ncbi:MAG: ATPase [Firmicutes bacterium]|nr:ATPase [Bacillota bacterium]